MSKFLRSVALFALAAICAAAFSACNVVKVTGEEYFTFTLNSETDTYSVSASGLEMPKTVIIPAEYNGKAVTAVDENGFSGKNCYAIKDVVFKCGGALEIGNYAFRGLTNLRSVEFRNITDVTIGALAFENTSSLKDVQFGKNTGNVEISSFAFKSSAIETLSVTAKNVTVGEYAFSGCESLKKLDFANLTEFAPNAVNACKALAEINNTGSGLKSVDGNLYSSDGSALIKYAPAAASESFTVDCQTVACEAFRDSVNLKTVTLSANVTLVEAFAFNSCSVAEIVCLGSYSEYAENWLTGSNATVIAE